MAHTEAGDDGAQAIPLPSDAHAPAIARAFVESNGADLPLPLVADALVLVSELVTNAVLHGRPDITLQVRPDPPGIGVAVTDEGDRLPLLADRPPDNTATSGRGLMIVDRIATDWGVRPNRPDPGKTVWFTLRAQLRQSTP